MDILDFRGQACPLPVIGLKKAIEGGIGPCTILVDAEEAVENLQRLAQHFSRRLEVENLGEEWRLTLGAQGDTAVDLSVTRIVEKGDRASDSVTKHGTQEGLGKRTLLVAKDLVGAEREGELGKELVKAFFFSLTEIDDKPKAVVAINRGVLLLAEDSPVSSTVAELQEQGLRFAACGLCLNYFHKKPLPGVEVTNMYAIATALLTEDVVNLP